MKGRDLEKAEGIFMNHLRTRKCFRPGTGENLLISPYLGFSGCCQGNCQLSWHW